MTWVRRPTRMRADTATGPRAPRSTRPVITSARPSLDVRSVETRRPGRALATATTVPWPLVPPAGGGVVTGGAGVTSGAGGGGASTTGAARGGGGGGGGGRRPPAGARPGGGVVTGGAGVTSGAGGSGTSTTWSSSGGGGAGVATPRPETATSRVPDSPVVAMRHTSETASVSVGVKRTVIVRAAPGARTV